MTPTEKLAAHERSAGRTIARNTAFGLAAQIALKIANFAFTILVIRTLGDEHFGQYSVILAWAGLFSVLGDLGINQYLGREIARDKQAAQDMFWDTAVLRLFLALFSSIITVGGAMLLTDYSNETIIGIALFTGTYYFSAAIAPLQSLLTGYERVDIVSVMNVVSQIMFMIMATLFLLLGFDFLWLVIAGVLNMPLIVIMGYVAVKRNDLGPPPIKIHPGTWGGIVKASFPFAVTHLTMMFNSQVDTIFLSIVTTNQVVGWYTAAYRLTLTLLNLSIAFNTAVLPTLARQHVNDPESVKGWYYNSVRFMMMLTLPIAVGGALLNREIISIFGEEYLPASFAFALLIWDLPFVVFHGFSGFVTASIKRESAAARIHVTIGVGNVILNALLIPRFGLVGACLATVLTDMAGAFLFFFLFRKELGNGLGKRQVIPIALSTIVMGMVVSILRGQSVFLIIPVSAIIYGIMIWATGAVTTAERQQIFSLVNRGRAKLRLS